MLPRLIFACACTLGALGCGNSALAPGGGDLAGASTDLAGADFAGADLASGGRDFSGLDLAGYSNIGGPCGGFTSMPRLCLPGLVCVSAQVPDAPGTCANPDAGACQPNGGACAAAGDCCSDNCILRGGTPGYCCEPGGCP